MSHVYPIEAGDETPHIYGMLHRFPSGFGGLEDELTMPQRHQLQNLVDYNRMAKKFNDRDDILHRYLAYLHHTRQYIRNAWQEAGFVKKGCCQIQRHGGRKRFIK